VVTGAELAGLAGAVEAGVLGEGAAALGVAAVLVAVGGGVKADAVVGAEALPLPPPQPASSRHPRTPNEPQRRRADTFCPPLTITDSDDGTARRKAWWQA
jgi:hypothetical protein